MKLTKRHLRKLIKEELLREQGEMLKIIANPTSPETEVFNKIANYALNDDIHGALADSDVNTEYLDLDIDSMRPWVKRVGGEGQWMDEDAVVPDNWDAEAVYDFMEDLESAWYDQRGKEGTQAHLSSPDVKEREAIGTGRVATPAQAQEAHAHIRSLLGRLFGEEVKQQCRVIYGGSVKPSNVAELTSQPDVDGALVGGAGLEPDSFSEIVAKTAATTV